MKRPSLDTIVDSIWLRLRRPFRYPKAGHACAWERYDADRAGCTLCGALHKCSGSMVGCECPLVETDEGGHVCLITGLCVSEVRAASCEFADSVCFEPARDPRSLDDDGIHDRVASVIRHFLTSEKTASCRRMEQEKYALRTKQAFWRVLKQRKRDHPYALPCLCSVVAEVAHSEQMQQSQCGAQCSSQTDPQSESCPDCHDGANHELTERVVRASAAGITRCIHQITRMGFKKICQGGKFQSMVVGMLYMSRTGLRVGELFCLPAVRSVQELLPSETYLNSLGVSNKVICDTENEIKSCIRAYAEGAAMSNNINNNPSASNSNNKRARGGLLRVTR